MFHRRKMMPKVIDRTKLVLAILAKRKKKVNRKIYLHIQTEYTPRDYISQRYRVIVSNYLKPGSKMAIVEFTDLLENEVSSISSRLIDQLSIPYDHVIINLTNKTDQRFTLDETLLDAKFSSVS